MALGLETDGAGGPAAGLQALGAPSAPRRSIAEQIAEYLRGQILSAGIGPDEALKQDHIARMFGVSQAPVREALRQLASEGLVVVRLNRGVRVAPLDGREAEEIAMIRLKLEPGLVREATKRFDAEGARAARAALGATAGAGDVLALMRADEAFHHALYRPAGQPITLEIASRLRSRYARYLGFMWRNTGHASTSLAEHRALLRLVQQGEGSEAARFLKRHIEGSTRVILESLRRDN